jgi:uncharacterized Zn finger protein
MTSACQKCGSKNTRVVGRSANPPMEFVQCDSCGHVSAVPEKK